MAKKEVDETLIDGLTPREYRLKKYQEKMAEKSAVVYEDDKEEFRKFFVKIKKKLKLAPEMEEILWIHLKAIKHDKKDLFVEGIEHFGYKV